MRWNIIGAHNAQLGTIGGMTFGIVQKSYDCGQFRWSTSIVDTIIGTAMSIVNIIADEEMYLFRKIEIGRIFCLHLGILFMQFLVFLLYLSISLAL